jgi:ribonuclease BN (tRNA processing enzyme)
MEVRLTVIGSSPAHPNPGSAHSGYLVEAPGCGRLLLDCGPGVLSRLRASDLLPVDAIAITHFHLDHWGDLVPWAWMQVFVECRNGLPGLWIPPGGRAELAAFAARWGTADMFDASFEVAEYRARAPFEVVGYEVEAYPVEHYGVAAFGLRVRDQGGRVLAYSGDSGPCDGLRALADHADLFLCEATLQAATDDPTPRGHMSATEALEASSGPILLTHRPFELATPDDARRAEDGLVVTI